MCNHRRFPYPHLLIITIRSSHSVQLPDFFDWATNQKKSQTLSYKWNWTLLYKQSAAAKLKNTQRTLNHKKYFFFSTNILCACCDTHTNSRAHTLTGTPQIRVANKNIKRYARAPPSLNDSYMHSLNACDNLWSCFAFNVRFLFAIFVKTACLQECELRRKYNLESDFFFHSFVSVKRTHSFNVSNSLQPCEVITFLHLAVFYLASFLCMFNFINMKIEIDDIKPME